MTEQTAMQELYSWFENTENWSRPDHKKEYEYQDILNKIESFVNKERQQMHEMYFNGGVASFNASRGKDFLTFEQLYENKYTNKNQIK